MEIADGVSRGVLAEQHGAMSENEPLRERHVHWSGPHERAAALATTDGLSFLRAVRDGALPPPPLNVLLGFVLVEAAEGSAVFVTEVAEYLSNGLGSVHGGALATLCDGAIGCAVHSTLPEGTGYATLELTMRFLRPVPSDHGQIRCAAGVVHRGRRTAIARAEVRDTDDRLLAEGSATCLLIPRMAEPPDA